MLLIEPVLFKVTLMKKVILFLLTFLISIHVYSQRQNYNWCFGDSGKVDFSQGVPSGIKSSMKSRGSCASICNSNGNLLFYSNTSNLSFPTFGFLTQVCNNNDQIMGNGDGIIGEGWYNELCIVPDLLLNNLYYLFTISITANLGFKYSVIDMNQNGGLGSVIQKNTPLLSIDLDDGMTAIKSGNGRDWWLIVHQWQTNSFYIFKITPNGISFPSIQNVGAVHNGRTCNFRFNEISNKLLVTNYWGLIEVFDFDRCSGNLSLFSTIETENLALQKQYFGSSISPNGRFIYVSNTDNIFGDSLRLNQYDLTAPNIAASKINIYTAQVPASGGMHAVAPDGKIYMACLYEEGFPYSDTTHNIYTDNLSVINHPDSLGLACDFQPFSFYLGGNRSYWGLPNNPNYDLGRDSGSVCDTLQWTGIMDANQSMQLTATIYPNPAKDKLTLQLSYLINQAELIICNALGEKCFSEKSITPSSTITIDVSKLKEGLYFLQIKSPQKILSLKFCKE